jgi:hypothetical protein
MAEKSIFDLSGKVALVTAGGHVFRARILCSNG